MNLPKRVEVCIKATIDHCLGLPGSERTLELELRAYEEIQRELQERFSLLQSQLKEKEDQIELARAEASMNAQAVKKFVEENQKLAAMCANLLAECKRWEGECSLYDNDREALMDFGNEAHERAKEAEARAQRMEEEVQRLSDELLCYKVKLESQGDGESLDVEETLLESVLDMVSNGGFMSATSFLETNNENESCRKLLNMWNYLRPTTQKVLSVVGEARKLEKDKEHLRVNLHKAEEEAKLLFTENGILNEENQRLLRHYQRVIGSGTKSPGTTSAKSNKRKSSTADAKRLDFGDMDLVRAPLSLLECCNSTDSRQQKRPLSSALD
ncbi:hypothetical protein SAY86_003710 [Trapa natans]|uniref:Uncharacterized protein n=1 Tax=Trapa natans TaxID=22666 RepID=A0AAN7M6L1_TRANT|nr:hypothetical protein SAY86_003710 [Trapa natans]